MGSERTPPTSSKRSSTSVRPAPHDPPTHVEGTDQSVETSSSPTTAEGDRIGQIAPSSTRATEQQHRRLQPADASAHWWNPERKTATLIEARAAAKRGALVRRATDAAHDHRAGEACGPD
jgi:hypothetical protein